MPASIKLRMPTAHVEEVVVGGKARVREAELCRRRREAAHEGRGHGAEIEWSQFCMWSTKMNLKNVINFTSNDELLE